MTSVPPSATLSAIVSDLFQNEVIKSEGMKEHYTFSDLCLSTDQQKLLTYPSNFIPMNIFILQQIDASIGKNFTTDLSMVSFVKNGDGYIYGYYFSITDQPRFEVECLNESKCPIKLDDGAKFVVSNLLEAYNDIFGTTVILSLNTKTPYATLQYSQCGKYYYELLTKNGINQPHFPATKLLSLSKNLKIYTSC
jgi:hypothetical protein